MIEHLVLNSSKGNAKFLFMVFSTKNLWFTDYESLIAKAAKHFPYRMSSWLGTVFLAVLYFEVHLVVVL